jgi:outer membrane protein assembly factor BamB
LTKTGLTDSFRRWENAPQRGRQQAVEAPPAEEGLMPYKLAFVCTVLIVLVPVVLAGADHVDDTALHEAGLAKFWQLRLPLQPGQVVADSYLVDDQIYVATRDGYAYAIHAPTGVIRWIKEVTTGGYRVRRPCHAGYRTIFVTPPAVMQYDRYSGEPIRKTELRFPSGSAPVSDGMRYYVGGIDQKMYAFYLDEDFEAWKARAGGQILARPALFDQYLYFAGSDGSIYACVAADKQFYGSAQVIGPVTADVAVDSENVYIATQDNSLHSFDRALRGVRWRVRFSGPLREPPDVAGDAAFQYCAEDGLVAVNTGTVGVEQRVRWTLPRGRRLLATDGGRAYVLSRDGNILVVQIADGDVLHTIAAPGFTLPMYSPGELALFIAARDGRVFCARKRGVPFPNPEQLRAALRVPRRPGEEEPAEAAEQVVEKPGPTEDYLQSKRPGPPIGGKSKVSREYQGE